VVARVSAVRHAAIWRVKKRKGIHPGCSGRCSRSDNEVETTNLLCMFLGRKKEEYTRRTAKSVISGDDEDSGGLTGGSGRLSGLLISKPCQSELQSTGCPIGGEEQSCGNRQAREHGPPVRQQKKFVWGETAVTLCPT
jgi:hypothetical protein